MSGKITLVLLALGVCLGLAWFALSDGEADGPVLAVEVENGAALERPASESTAAADGLGADEARRTSARTGGGDLTVVIVDAASGAPLEDAALILLKNILVPGRPSLPPGRRGSLPETLRIPPTMLDAGVEYRTDARGTVVVPRPSEAVLFVARHGNLHLRGLIRPGTVSEFRLALEPDERPRVLVVDAADRPVAGIRVKAVPWLGHSRGGERRYVTDRRGIAILENARRREEPLLDRVEVTLEAHLPEPVRAILLPADEFREPLRLVLPPTGTVTVEVLDRRELASPESPQIYLVVLPRSGGFGGQRHRVRGTAGTVTRVHHVGLGMRLRVEVVMEPSGASVQAEFEGPARAGEEASAVVEISADHPVLTGRIVDEDGKDCETCPYQVDLIQAASGRKVVGTARGTHGGHRFRFDYSTLSARNGLELQVETFGSNAAPARAVAELPSPLPDGVTDLGDLVLKRPPTLAAGRVVDQDGGPVAGAHVTLHVPRQGTQAAGSWEPATGVQGATADADGRFEVRSWKPLEPPFALSAYVPRFNANERVDLARTAILPLEPGRELEARITMLAHGSLSGRLLVAPDVPQGALQVHVRGPDKQPRTVIPRPWEDWRFTWPSIPAGAYVLIVTLRGDPTPVFTAENVVVPPGRPAEDARLVAIDLSHVLRPVRLTVVGPDGRAVEGGSVIVLGEAGAEPSESLALVRGRAEITSSRTSLDLEVRVPGYRPVRLEDVDGDRRIELQQGIPVRLRLVAPAVPAPPLYLGAVLEPLDPDVETGRSRLSRAEHFDAFGLQVSRVPAPGRYRLTWRAVRKAEGSIRAVPVSIVPETILEIGEGEAERVFEVSLPPGDLEAVLRRLER